MGQKNGYGNVQQVVLLPRTNTFHKMRLVACLLPLAALAQGPGNGISKATYACDDPAVGHAFLLRYFPVRNASDECEHNACKCTWQGETFDVQQGRVYLDVPGEEQFGLHLVNSTAHWTHGAKSVAEVDAIVGDKLADLGSRFDAWADFRVTLIAADLDSYIEAFERDGVGFHAFRFPATAAEDWYGVLVHVPRSQMVLELVATASASLATRGTSLTTLEPRLSARAVAQVEAGGLGSLHVASVGRACSDVAAVEAFYGSSMNATLTLAYDGANASARCYLWRGAAVDVCFVARAASSTRGDFKVATMESMLRSTHETILVNPNCGRAKWEDHHYALDARSMNADFVLDYLKANPEAKYVCNGRSVHFVFDPTGWAVQLDVNYSRVMTGCDWRDWDWDLEPDFSCWGGDCAAPRESALALAASRSPRLGAAREPKAAAAAAAFAGLGVALAVAFRRRRLWGTIRTDGTPHEHVGYHSYEWYPTRRARYARLP